METTKAAHFTFPLGPACAGDPGGLDDYTGPLMTWFRLEEFSHPFLVRQAKEYALDNHLLMRAAYWTAQENWGTDFLDATVPQHRAAFAPGLVERLRAAMRIEGNDLETIGKVLQLDPVHVPDYTRFSYQLDGDSLLVSLDDCEALHDDPISPLLPVVAPAGAQPGFEHMARAVNPRAQVESTSPRTWRVWIDPSAEPVEQHPLAAMVNLHEITTFDLSARPETPVEVR